ncbi:hypothetical protein [Leifsonia shinshuensis]|uniref:hypothetical protein n=1 Tax=Leifsonia shinshuensis TaxID=150026 RepID=UPI0031EA6CB9
MKLSALFREAGRNIVTGTTRFALLGILSAVVFASLVLLDALTTSGLVASAERFRSSGAATEILVAEGRVDGAACEALAGVPGVTASGALRSSARKITIATLPDAPVPAHEVSPGFSAVVSDRAGSPSGVLLPRELADMIRAGLGDEVATDAGPMRVAEVFDYPSDGRRPGFGYAILSVGSALGSYDECWATAWPQLPNLRTLLLATMSPSAGDGADKPQIMQLNSSQGASFEGNASFTDRLTRAAAPAAAVIAAGIGFAGVRMRRLQHTSALHAGLRKGDLLALGLLEAGGWAAAAGVIGVGAAAVGASMVERGDQFAVFASLVGIPLAGVAGALIGTAVAAAAMSEKHLFRYFKDR